MRDKDVKLVESVIWVDLSVNQLSRSCKNPRTFAIGATKERHVIEAAEAAKIQLTAEEITKLEALADATGIDTRGGWEHSME